MPGSGHPQRLPDQGGQGTSSQAAMPGALNLGICTWAPESGQHFTQVQHPDTAYGTFAPSSNLSKPWLQESPESEEAKLETAACKSSLGELHWVGAGVPRNLTRAFQLSL